MNTLARAERAVPARVAWLLAMLGDYYELGKPRIMYLLLVTTAATMVMAQRGMPSLPLLGWTMLAGAFAAMSAGALNCVYDMDIDRLMKRTAARPLPSGRLTAFQATAHACMMGVLSFAIFFLRVDHLAAWLSLAGNVYYVVIYTMLLKRRTPQNIVIGGAAGSIPALVGWAAVTHGIAWPAVGLFAIVFLWTPPHSWALALMTETDYGKAGIPMMPNVRGDQRTVRYITLYTLALAVFSIALYWPLHVMGPLYAAAALALGSIFVYDAIALERDPGKIAARKMFGFSLLYLAAMCAAMVADRIIF